MGRHRKTDSEGREFDFDNILMPYKGADNQWYWRFVNPYNHKIQAVGGEGFGSEWGAERGIEDFEQEMIDYLEEKGLVRRLNDGDAETEDGAQASP